LLAASLLLAVVAESALAAAPKKAPAPPAPAPPSIVAPRAGPQLRQIALDPTKPKAVYEIHASPGLSTTIQLPEDWAVTPVCGDCVFGDAALTTQLWRLDLSPETRTINIKPTRLPGPDVPGSAFLTNLDVTLKGGLAITLFVKLTLPEEADARVEFSLPEAAMGTAKASKLERELEEQFDTRVEQATGEKLLDALIVGTKCKDFMGRPTRTDSLVVRLKQLCQNGALLYLTFEIENRQKNDAQLANATLTDTAGNTSSLVKFQAPRLRFNQRTLGIAGIPLASQDVPPSTYTLTVQEDGGKERQVTVDGIDF
jgi:hypothetical protein